MAQNSDLLFKYEAALGRLQGKPREFGSDRQKPIVQWTRETPSSRAPHSSHENALIDAANALAALWKASR